MESVSLMHFSSSGFSIPLISFFWSGFSGDIVVGVAGSIYAFIGVLALVVSVVGMADDSWFGGGSCGDCSV